MQHRASLAMWEVQIQVSFWILVHHFSIILRTRCLGRTLVKQKKDYWELDLASRRKLLFSKIGVGRLTIRFPLEAWKKREKRAFEKARTVISSSTRMKLWRKVHMHRNTFKNKEGRNKSNIRLKNKIESTNDMYHRRSKS
jgi:hypothetical protein